MNDKELLEFAAIAAGLKLRYNYLGGRDARQPWDPLTDDGDALRLAVKLDLPFRKAFNDTFETGNDKSGRPIWEFLGSDTCAAARRAIVRAAAEIGKR